MAAEKSRTLDLFVSYATADAREIAENLVVDLERRGLHCWIAPRDIPAGTRSWASEIMRNIRESDNFLLLLSEAANGSEEIEKELSEAARQRKTVFVIRISDIEPSDGLGYHLNRVQWRDLFRNREDVLNEVCNRVLALRAAKPQAETGLTKPFSSSPVPMPQPNSGESGKARKAPPWTFTAGAIGGIAAIGLAAVLYLRPADPTYEKRDPAVSSNTVSPTVATQTQASAPANLPPAQLTTSPLPAIIPPATPPAPVAPESSAAQAESAKASPTVQPLQPSQPVMTKEEEAISIRQTFRDRVEERVRPKLSASYNIKPVLDRYLASGDQRALVVAENAGLWYTRGLSSTVDAMISALEGCEIRHGRPCTPVAASEKIVPDADTTARTMPRLAYDGVFEPNMVPLISQFRSKQPDIRDYHSAPSAKAAALSLNSQLFIVTGKTDLRSAENQALSDCNTYNISTQQNTSCLLYASAGLVVLPRRATTPISPTTPAAVTHVTPPTVVPVPETELPSSVQVSFRDKAIAAHQKSVPGFRNSATQIDTYISEKVSKAIVIGGGNVSWRRTDFSTGEQALTAALEGCEIYRGEPCEPFMMNNDFLLPGSHTALRALAQSRISYEGVYDAQKVPLMREELRRHPNFANYGTLPGNKAIAITANGRYFRHSGQEKQHLSERAALNECNEYAKTISDRLFVCYLYASGNTVVLPKRSLIPITPEGK